jgi:hypothetical protein
MVQEEVTRSALGASKQTVVLVFTGVELTAELLAKAMRKIIGDKNKSGTTKDGTTKDNTVVKGKQSVKQLLSSGDVTSLDVTEKNVGSFKRVARKYGVDFAVRKDKSTEPPRWMVFFKGKDQDVIDAAFREYTGNVMGRENRKEKAAELKEGVMEKLGKMKQAVKEKAAAANEERKLKRNEQTR